MELALPWVTVIRTTFGSGSFWLTFAVTGRPRATRVVLVDTVAIAALVRMLMYLPLALSLRTIAMVIDGVDVMAVASSTMTRLRKRRVFTSTAVGVAVRAALAYRVCSMISLSVIPPGDRPGGVAGFTP